METLFEEEKDLIDFPRPFTIMVMMMVLVVQVLQGPSFSSIMNLGWLKRPLSGSVSFNTPFFRIDNLLCYCPSTPVFYLTLFYGCIYIDNKFGLCGGSNDLYVVY